MSGVNVTSWHVRVMRGCRVRQPASLMGCQVTLAATGVDAALMAAVKTSKAGKPLIQAACALHPPRGRQSLRSGRRVDAGQTTEQRRPQGRTSGASRKLDNFEATKMAPRSSG